MPGRVKTNVNTEKLAASVDKLVREASSPQIIKQVAEETVDRMRTRVRLGFGATDTNERYRLKPLSRSYRDQRRGKIAFFTKGSGPERVVVPYEPKSAPQLDETTAPAKSNLTFTGQMLRALKVLSVSAKKAIIGIDNSRRKRSLLTNKQVAEFVQSEPLRRFMNLTKQEIAGIQRLYRDLLRKRLR